jgi:CBS domain-containing protein
MKPAVRRTVGLEAGGRWIMRVQDVMTRQVRTVREGSAFKEAVELLLAADVSGLPVVDEYGSVVGIVSEADLMAKEAGGPLRKRRPLGVLARGENRWAERAEGTTVAEVMTKDPIMTSPDEDVRAAARLMLEHGIKRMPVVSTSGRLVGIVSRHDVLKAFHVTDEHIVRSVQRLLERSFYVAPEHEISVTASNGVVKLSGIVARASDVDIAPIIAGAADGVVGVVSELSYRERDPKPDRWGAGVG